MIPHRGSPPPPVTETSRIDASELPAALPSCGACKRHVRADETRCPFCGAPLEGLSADRSKT